MKMGVDQLAVHFSMEGNMLHRESEDGRRQLSRMGLGTTPSGGEVALSELEIPGEEDLEIEEPVSEVSVN